MKRIFSAAAVLSMFAVVGCSSALLPPQAASDADRAAPSSRADASSEKTAPSEGAAESAKNEADADAVAVAEKAPEAAAAASAEPWAAGDFVVYRFTGSFHKTPMTLTQKVIARSGESFTLDVTFDDGKTKEAMRAHMKGDAPMHADVVSVARLVRGVEQPASAALYEEIFARVALVADQNEAKLGSETVKIEVAGRGALACERATYRVKVGKETATMRTLANAGFVWGDVGAEITAEGGKVIYKAEVVEAGHESAKAPAIASTDDDY
jgi:hypothetical protein